ncbi:unnamed protein product [Trichobilharzia regenti]|nr:unnamed protein product [Trichobilharzia regenti]
MCDDNGAVKEPVVATGKTLLNRVSQTTPKFVQKNRVTVAKSSSDSTSLQSITSQSKGIKPVRIYEEEHKLSTFVIKEFENDEFDHTNGGKVDACDDDHDGTHLSLVDHDETSGMPTTTELNKGSVHCEREVELKADAVTEVVTFCETSCNFNVSTSEVVSSLPKACERIE